MLRNQAGPRWGSQFSHLGRLPTAQDIVMNQPLKYFSRLTQALHISLLPTPLRIPLSNPTLKQTFRSSPSCIVMLLSINSNLVVILEDGDYVLYCEK